MGTHGAHNLLAVRLSPDKVDPSIFDYVSPVPLFKSGAEAARHGVRAIRRPGPKAKKLMGVLLRKLRKRKDKA